MKYLSLFSGIGGFELGIGPEHECVGYSEINKYAVEVYNKHFPTHKNYGDITKINEKELPDFDLLVGGFPCQAFSIAGKRKGFADTRGTLFFDIARIIREKRPKFILLENVKGLLSHDSGNTFKTIIATLNELGYDLQWQVLNSKDFGVPQSRERIFIVGYIRGISRPQVLPFGKNAEISSIENPTDQRQSQTQIASTIRTKQGSRADDNFVVYIPEATKKGYAEAYIGDSINLSVLNSKTRRGRVGKHIAQTIDTNMQQYTLTPDFKIRRLTPLECERLMAYPDNWTKGLSDTQRYKTLGNGIVSNIVREIIKKIK